MQQQPGNKVVNGNYGGYSGRGFIKLISEPLPSSSSLSSSLRQRRLRSPFWQFTEEEIIFDDNSNDDAEDAEEDNDFEDAEEDNKNENDYFYGYEEEREEQEKEEKKQPQPPPLPVRQPLVVHNVQEFTKSCAEAQVWFAMQLNSVLSMPWNTRHIATCPDMFGGYLACEVINGPLLMQLNKTSMTASFSARKIFEDTYFEMFNIVNPFQAIVNLARNKYGIKIFMIGEKTIEIHN